MKRLIIAVAMLAFSVALAVCGYFMTENATDEVSVAFDNCMRKEKTEKKNIENIKKTAEIWNKNKKILFIFLPHDEFSEIEKNLIKMKYFMYDFNFEESSELSFECVKFLKNINEEHKLSVQTVF